MKITKDRFQSWEGGVYYEANFDDEFIIMLEPNETSFEMSEYILLLQEKADKYDKMMGNKK